MTRPTVAEPVRETLVVHEPDPQVVVEPVRTVLELTLDGHRTVYFVEPNTGSASAAAFLALQNAVTALTARVAVLEGGVDGRFPSTLLFPSPTLYPKAG